MSLLLALTGGTAAGAYTLTAASGSYALAGRSAGVAKSRRVIAAVGGYALTGVAAGIAKGYKLTAVSGNYACTGVAANITYTPMMGVYVLTANASAYAANGVAANVRRNRFITGAAGAYALSGAGATVSKSKKLAANAGSYAFSGNPANTLKGKRMAAAGSAYALTGNAATVSYTPSAVAYTLNCAAGSYAVAGNDVGLSSAGLKSNADLVNPSYPAPKQKKAKSKALGGHYWKPEELAQIEPLVTKQPIAKLPVKEPEPITPKPRINRLDAVVRAHSALADIGIHYKQVPVDYSQVINTLQIEIQRQKDEDDYAIATLMAMLL